MMRDRGFNFFCYDRYVDPFYVPHHVAKENGVSKAAILTCFEVLEHLPNPAKDLEEIFSFEPDIVIATTECYQGQDTRWPYLSVENGQHVFFYSAESLSLIAQTYGYGVISSGVTHIFYSLAPRQLKIDPAEIRSLGRDLISSFLRGCAIQNFYQTFSEPYKHVLVDHQAIVERYNTTSQPEPPKVLRRSTPRPPASMRPDIAPILVDGVMFQVDETRGIARVWREVFKHWAKTDFGQRILILDRAGTVPPTPGLKRVQCDPRPKNSLLSDGVVLQRYCDRLGAKAFISTYLSAPQTTPSVMLVHDMIPERLPHLFTASPQTWEEKKAYMQMAQRIVCVSENTRRDVLELTPGLNADHVEVAHLGVCAAFTPQPETHIQAVCQAHGIDQPYLIQVGGRASYKNGQLLINSWLHLPETERPLLVFVGGEPMQDEVIKVVGDKLRHVRSIDDQGLAALYSGALAMAMPSLYEGFGLPVIEAMACKCPVICSSVSSLPEVAGGAALLVAPDDIDGMKNAIRSVKDPATRKTMIAQGQARAAQFTWATLATTLQNTLEAIAGR